MDRPHVGEVGTVDAASNESEGDSYPRKGGGEGAREVQTRLEVVKSHYQVCICHMLYHISHITYHISHIIYHISHITYHISHAYVAQCQL